VNSVVLVVRGPWGQILPLAIKPVSKTSVAMLHLACGSSHPGSQPAGALRASKFVPGKFVAKKTSDGGSKGGAGSPLVAVSKIIAALPTIIL
jgi:hypothetical protein